METDFVVGFACTQNDNNQLHGQIRLFDTNFTQDDFVMSSSPSVRVRRVLATQKQRYRERETYMPDSELSPDQSQIQQN